MKLAYLRVSGANSLTPPTRKRVHEKAPAGSRGRKGDEEVAAEEICLIMSTTAILVSSIGSFLFTKGFIKRKARMRKIGVFVEVIAVIVALLNALWYLILLAWRASQ